MTTYSCSAVRGAVRVCIAAGWRGHVSPQGTLGSICVGHAAMGPMVTATTVDASAVWSAGLYCLSPTVSRARCLQAAVRVVASPLLYRGGGVEQGALLQRLRALPRQEGGRGRLREALRSQALLVRVVRVLSAVLRGRPGKEEELLQVPVALRAWTVCGVLTTDPPRLPGCAASSRRCNSRRPRRFDVPAGRMWVCR